MYTHPHTSWGERIAVTLALSCGVAFALLIISLIFFTFFF